MGDRRYRGVITQMFTSVMAGLIGAGLIAYLSFHFREPISAYAARQNPTCTAPTGLVEVPSLKVRGPSDPEQEHPASHAVDGYLGSLWVPPLLPGSVVAHQALFDEGEAMSTITVRLPETTDIALICVNNGLANNRLAYENWGKVRTVSVWKDRSSDSTSTTLASQPGDAMQTAQRVAEDLGETDHFTLQVHDAYAGSTVEGFDPDWCGSTNERVDLSRDETVQLRDTRGCLIAPSARAGISEVTVFEAAD